MNNTFDFIVESAPTLYRLATRREDVVKFMAADKYFYGFHLFSFSGSMPVLRKASYSSHTDAASPNLI